MADDLLRFVKTPEGPERTVVDEEKVKAARVRYQQPTPRSTTHSHSQSNTSDDVEHHAREDFLILLWDDG